MKTSIARKKIIRAEGILTLITGILLAGSAVLFLYADRSLLTDRQIFVFAGDLTAMALGIAIPIGAGLTRRVFRKWHLCFLLIHTMNFLCLFLDGLYRILPAYPAAARAETAASLLQILFIFLGHILFLQMISTMTRKTNIIRGFGIGVLALVAALGVYLVTLHRNDLLYYFRNAHSGRICVYLSLFSFLILVLSAIPAVISSIPHRWKIAVLSYPVLFGVCGLFWFLIKESVYPFCGIMLASMCCYAMMYGDSDEPVIESGSRENFDVVSEHPQEKTMSILCCSLRDFSYVANYMREEIAVNISSRFLTDMMETVAFFGGRIIAFPSCSFVAVFGAEKNNAGYKARAIGAALEMAGKMEAINAWCRENDYPRIYEGIAIVTDRVRTGYVGNENCSRYAVCGEALDLCDRLERKCGEGEILVSESTIKDYVSPLYMQKCGSLEKKDGTVMDYWRISKSKEQI